MRCTKTWEEFQIILKPHLSISTLKSGAQQLGILKTIWKSQLGTRTYINSAMRCTIFRRCTMFVNLVMKNEHNGDIFWSEKRCSMFMDLMVVNLLPSEMYYERPQVKNKSVLVFVETHNSTHLAQKLL